MTLLVSLLNDCIRCVSFQMKALNLLIKYI
jgi:hypothetical protein